MNDLALRALFRSNEAFKKRNIFVLLLLLFQFPARRRVCFRNVWWEIMSSIPCRAVLISRLKSASHEFRYVHILLVLDSIFYGYNAESSSVHSSLKSSITQCRHKSVTMRKTWRRARKFKTDNRTLPIRTSYVDIDLNPRTSLKKTLNILWS